jgi:hypothetical protein
LNGRRGLHDECVIIRRRGARRGGYVYLAVLFTSLIVVATVAAALSISTLNLRSESDRSGRMTALRHAESELHRIAAGMRTSELWRGGSTHAVFSDWYGITADGVGVAGSPLFRHRFSDSDGQLDDNVADSVELTVHVRVDGSDAAITATLEADPVPYDFLQYSVTATDDIRFESNAALSCERPVQVVDDCWTTSWGILTTPRLECGDAVEITLRGDLASANVVMPSRDVLNDFVTAGTEISSASLPDTNGYLTMEDIVLSPTINPFGGVDAAGIYWLDAGGGAVRISHCRLDATLAIRNAAIIEVTGGINWSYPLTPGAILVSDSDIRFEAVEETLDEVDRAINFNPIASPHRLNMANSDTTDVYPTELRGVIYTTGHVRVNSLENDATLRLTGAIACQKLRIWGHLSVTQLDELITDPAVGLSDPTPMRFVRGTQRRIPSP